MASPAGRAGACFERAEGAPDRWLGDVVFDRQIGHGLASSVAVGDLAPLTGIEGGGPAELGTLALGPRDTFIAARADQRPLELANAAHNCHYQPADVGRGVAPSLA